VKGLYKRGRIWWLSFFHNRKRITVNTKQTEQKDAEDYAEAYRADVRRDIHDPFGAKADTLVSQTLARYLRLHIKVNRPASFERCWYILKYLRAFFWKTPVSRVRTRVDEYKAWRKAATVRTATINKEIAILKAALSKAVEYGLISDNPMRGYRLEKENNQRTRFLEGSEFYRLINAAHPDLVPILKMARYTGMRQGEILGLQWGDVDLKRGFAHLRHTKSGESRMVPLSTEVVDMLSKTPLSERQGYIFRHKSHDPIRAIKVPHDGTAQLKRQGWLMEEFRKAVRIAGISDFRGHDLRHSWASHAAMRGVDVQTIAAVLGHKTLRMTQRYTHFSAAHLKASVELAAPRKSQPNATKTLQSEPNKLAASDLTKTVKKESPQFLAGILDSKTLCPQRDSNPSYSLERAVT